MVPSTAMAVVSMTRCMRPCWDRNLTKPEACFWAGAVYSWLLGCVLEATCQVKSSKANRKSWCEALGGI